MTELTAVNICLTQGGSMDAVNTVVGNEALRAKSILDLTRKSLLLKGFKFNEDKIDLNRNTGGEIILPKTYLAIELPSPFIVRDGKIYNPDTRSFLPGQDFAASKVALFLDFEKLPEVAADWIAWESCKHFAASFRSAGGSQYAYAANEAATRSVTLSGKYPAKIENDYGANAMGSGTCGLRWCGCS